MRKKWLVLNSILSLVSELLTIVSGFIVPRLILNYYGSSVNGLISSITYFLSLISLCQFGIGPVIQANLYKPLAESDTDGLSKIMKSANRFFRTISLILLIYVMILVFVYPNFVTGKHDFAFVAGLIVIMSINTFAQYYFGIANRLLLTADQHAYVYLFFNSTAIFINMIACVVLIKNGMALHTVKLFTSLIFIVPPIMITMYVHKHYKLNYKTKIEGEPIKQKWNGFAQHIATIVQDNTDIIILTTFSTLENVSIYSVYHLVTNGIRQLVVTVNNGITSLLGNMIANGENEKLNDTFDFFEWFIHTISTLLYSIAGVMIISFVKLYTKGVHDIDYIVPGFGIVIVVCGALRCIELAYNMPVSAAGHFKQTQIGVFIEPIINICLSVVAVSKFGLIGITVGTLVSLIYRIMYFVYYLSKNILFRPMRLFIKKAIIDMISVALIVVSCNMFHLYKDTVTTWIISSVIVSVISLVIVSAVNVVFNRDKIVLLLSILKKKKNGEK